MKIAILITGGTIDDLEYNREENAPKYQKTIIPSLIKQARVTERLEPKIVCFISGSDTLAYQQGRLRRNTWCP